MKVPHSLGCHAVNRKQKAAFADLRSRRDGGLFEGPALISGMAALQCTVATRLSYPPEVPSVTSARAFPHDWRLLLCPRYRLIPCLNIPA